jgi:tetratricopeptide (TPR) repeat protein
MNESTRTRLGIAETIGHPFALNMAYSGLGHVYLRRGNLPQAMSAFERCVSLCREWNIWVHMPFSEGNLSHVHMLSGRAADAIAGLDTALKHATAMGFVPPRLNIPVWLSEAYLLAGRCDAAAQVAAVALDGAREHKTRGTEAWALRLRGEIASQCDSKQVAQARSYYDDARALAEQLGMRPLVAHCHAGLAKLYARAGRSASAQQHLLSAVTMYRDMGMRFWLEKLEAELAAR